MAEKSNRLLAVIRVRGTVKVRHQVVETLKRLNLRRVNNLVLVRATKDYLGMVQHCKDFVTFGEINGETLSRLLKVKEINVKAEDVETLLSGEKSARDLGIAMPIRMHPPRHGYEGILRSYRAGGALGQRGGEINELISRML